MKTWKLATMRLACGWDQQCWIVSGSPYLEIEGKGPNMMWRKVRCAHHAGEPVPAVIEPTPQPVPKRSRRSAWDNELPEELQDVKPMSGMAGLAKAVRMGPKLLTFDPKMKQAGDRDD